MNTRRHSPEGIVNDCIRFDNCQPEDPKKTKLKLAFFGSEGVTNGKM